MKLPFTEFSRWPFQVSVFIWIAMALQGLLLGYLSAPRYLQLLGTEPRLFPREADLGPVLAQVFKM